LALKLKLTIFSRNLRVVNLFEGKRIQVKV
jgi:hypothetical protein